MFFISIGAFLAGVGLSGFSFYIWINKRDKQSLQIKIEKEQLEKETNQLRIENQNYKEEAISLLKENSTLKAQKEAVEKNLETQMQYYEDKKKDREEHFKQLAEKTKSEFENIANKIFLENNRIYHEASTKNITQILNPFKEDITGFKNSIQGFKNKEKFLDDTIKEFTTINSKMRDETLKLEQALKGSSKTQGHWGEIFLANVLESSGLREGKEFILQGKNLNVKNEEGASVRPDAIVKLPDNKHIIIDSKVSFTHYREYLSANTEEDRKIFLGKTLNSISSHIDNLSSKQYQFSEGLKTPDFVLMFIPNEGVFSLTTQSKKDLFHRAWKKSIVIVSPTTLYATLRTIASVWKIERQNKNAEEIAKQGGLLYDKFASFLEDMNKIDLSLRNARNSYEEASKKLQDGKGNLLHKANKLKALGVITKKEIPNSFDN